MKIDYLDACERHWSDAKLLFDKERWANADHLYGIAVECGLKRLMQAFGMEMSENGLSPKLKEDRVHANKIWTRYESYRSGRVQGRIYGLCEDNPFLEWDVSDRYANRDNFDRALVEAHKKGCDDVCALIRLAQVNGDLA